MNRDDAISPVLCRHHWIIEPANGRWSPGRCKRCGTERDFTNNAEDALLENHRSRGASSNQQVGPGELAVDLIPEDLSV